MCAVGSLTTERVTQYVGEQGKENRWPDDQPRGGAQDAQRPQPTWSSSKRGLEVVTGERLEIERLTSRSEEGRWKSTHRGNSLAAYPTASTVRGGGHATPEKVNGPYSTQCRVGPVNVDFWTTHWMMCSQR
jgi:hypothetical protein